MNTEPNISKSVFIHNPNSLSLSVPYQEEEKNNQVNTAQNLVEISYTLKEGEYIANGVKVIKLLFETEHSKFYLANIEEINENILIKTISYELDDGKSEELLLKLSQEINKVYQLLNDNILLYYDYIQFEEEQKALIFMENIPYCQSLLVYFHNYNKYNTNKKSFLKLQADDFIIMGFRYMQWLIVNRKDDSPSGFILFSIRFAYLLYSYYDIQDIQFQQIIQHLMRHHDSRRVYHFALFLIFAYSTGNGISISTKYPEKLDVFNHYDIRLDYYSKIFQEWNLHDVYYMMGGFMTLSTLTIPLVSVLPKVNSVTPLRLPSFNATTIVSTIMQATQLVDPEFHELMKMPECKK